MSARTRLAVAAALIGAASAATVVPAITSAQPDPPRELTLRMKVMGGAQFHHGRPTTRETLATGDRVLVRLRVFGEDRRALGRAFTECTNVGPKATGLRAVLQCTQTYRLADGTIVTTGVARFSELQKLSVPIVGGSGAYRGASGELTAGAPAKGFDSVDVLRLDG